jgi:hypothetical protein
MADLRILPQGRSPASCHLANLHHPVRDLSLHNLPEIISSVACQDPTTMQPAKYQFYPIRYLCSTETRNCLPG